MFGNIIRALIYLCFLAIAYYLIIWVLAGIGIHIPQMVMNILGIILVLVAILVLYNLFWPALSNYDWGSSQPSSGNVI
jgi:hypothetical protein